MRYQKANEILPKELVELIQSYMDGGYVYIPRKEENRKSWGETSSARKEIQARNREIYKKYRQGMKVQELAEQFYLSEKSIQRIVLQEKKLAQRNYIRVMRAVHRINGCTVFRSHREITAAGWFLRRIVISGVRMRYSSGACCVKVVIGGT